MAKFYGPVGYVETVEVEPGIWDEQVTEAICYGDFVRNTSKFQTSGDVVDDKDISTEISIIADPYANQDFTKIRYVEYMGTKWKVTSAEPKYPRIILTLGGVYNG